MLDFILGNKAIIGSVVGGVGVWAGYKWLMKDIKEIFKAGADVHRAVTDARADGVFTNKEIDNIAAKSGKLGALIVVAGIKIRKLLRKK